MDCHYCQKCCSPEQQELTPVLVATTKTEHWCAACVAAHRCEYVPDGHGGTVLTTPEVARLFRKDVVKKVKK